MPSLTAEYAFILPTVGGDTGLWGGFLNANWTELEALLTGVSPITSIDVTGTIDANVIAASEVYSGFVETAILRGIGGANVTIDFDLVTSPNPLAIEKGGTNAITAAAARTNLGATTVGNDVFTAVDATAARTALQAQRALQFEQNLEFGQQGSGDRTTLIDFHSSGAPGALDFSARIIRNAGVNGALDIINTGTGGVLVNGSPLGGSTALAAIGTYAILRGIIAFTGTPGDLVAGANLRYANVAGNITGAGIAGTWRLMGNSVNTNPETGTCVYVRVS